MKAIFDLDLIVGGESDEAALSLEGHNDGDCHILPHPYPIVRKPIGLPKPHGIDDDLDDIQFIEDIIVAE